MSEHIMEHFISPSFSYEKLDSPSYADLVDVLEDRIRNWLFLPAEKLLNTPNCDIAAVALMVNYFEGIEIYVTGEDSKNKSFEFFTRGFGRVFTVRGQDSEFSCKIAAAIYRQVRCGFAHDGMFRNRIFFSRVRPEPILVTWPKEKGVFDRSADFESILINPPLFYKSITIHLDRYLQKLRDGTETVAKCAFENAVALKWGIGEREPAIGMTKDEFFKG